MISLTYLSSASHDLDEPELEAILGTSRANNAATGLSGMLLYAEGHFIQTLEGEADVVDEAFARIQADPRHRNVVIALREEIDERRFSGWTMGFTRMSPEDAATVPGFSDYLDPESALYANTKALGHAGVFHRIFRDSLRVQQRAG